MKQRNLAPALALIMSLELILAPVAVHAQQHDDAAGTFNSIVGVAASVYGMIAQKAYIPSPQTMADMDGLGKQGQALPDKYFNPQKLSQIPGLGEYMAINGINPQRLNCTTLPTTMYEAHPDVCEIGVTMDKGDPNRQVQEAFMYKTQYSRIEKTYKNFSTESNVGGEQFGVGCMKNAMQILNGFFKYRVDELDKLVTNIEALQNSFKEASKSDLDAIEESTAVLNGGGSELANKVKTRRPDLFDFGKRFDNPACKSMFPKDDFNKMGKDKGLNAINQKLQDTVATPVGAMGYTGDSYSKANADVIADIHSLADKVGKQMELGFSTLSESNKGYSDIVGGLKGLSSSNKINGALSPDLFSDMQTKFSEKNDLLRADMSDVGSELGPSGGNAMNLVRGTNSAAFESEVNTIETNIKNGCLKNSAQTETVIAKIYDPTTTGFANKNASNFLKDKLKQIMDNDKTTLPKKLAELKALEVQQGSRYFVKMENSYEVQEVDGAGQLTTRVVSASTARTPSTYFSDIIKNCESQFKANTLGNKFTGDTAIKKLRKLHQDYKGLAKSHANEVKEEIRKKLISCDSPAKANNTVPGSCKPDSFDTSKPGFCAAGAMSCSKNMQACTKQAEKFVDDIKKERTARVGNYKNLVEKNKKDIVKIFDSALSRYMKDGEQMRGVFGTGFSSPSGIQRDVPEGQKHLALFQQATQGSPDGTLMLEDPEKFTAMFKSNIQLLKASVEKQQEQILGGAVGSNTGILAQHMNDTLKKYQDVVKDAATFASTCDQQYKKYLAQAEADQKARQADQMKKQQELGEQSNDFCQKYGQAQTHPGPACKGVTGDFAKDLGRISGWGPGVNELRRVCDSFSNEGSGSGGGGDPVTLAYGVCGESNAGPAAAAPHVATEPTTQEEKDLIKTKKKAEQDVKLRKADLISAKAKNPTPKAVEGKPEPEIPKAVLDAESAVAMAEKEVLEADYKLVEYQDTAKEKKEANAGKEAEKATAKAEKEKAAKEKAAAKEPPKADRSISELAHGGGGSTGDVKHHCERLIACKQTPTYHEGKVNGHTSNCSDEERKSIASSVMKASGNTIVADPNLAPAFCSAGNNSMGPPKGFFDNVQQGLNKGMAAGAVGQ